MALKTTRYYNVAINKPGEFFRVGDKAYPLPPIGEYIDIPVKYEKALKRRYGHGFSKSPRVASQMKVANRPEGLSNEQLLAEIKHLQEIANSRFNAEEPQTTSDVVNIVADAPVPDDVLAALEADEDPVALSQEETVALTEVAPAKGRGKSGK